jgi:hypothetical protein
MSWLMKPVCARFAVASESASQAHSNLEEIRYRVCSSRSNFILLNTVSFPHFKVD